MSTHIRGNINVKLGLGLPIEATVNRAVEIAHCFRRSYVSAHRCDYGWGDQIVGDSVHGKTILYRGRRGATLVRERV